MNNSILIVEDDDFIRETKRSFLEAEGFTIHESTNDADALKMVQSQSIDLILLDIMLETGNGIDLMKQIKEFTNVPIIIVSSKSELVDKILGLEMGADDYLCKPVDMKELLSRIKANLRRYQQDQETMQDKHQDSSLSSNIVFGPWTINSDNYSVMHEDGKNAELTKDEFDLLHTLAGSPNIVFSREKLFEMLKPDNYESYDRTIDIQVARIRKKLGDDAKNPKYIKTVRQVGYIFVADILSTG